MCGHYMSDHLDRRNACLQQGATADDPKCQCRKYRPVRSLAQVIADEPELLKPRLSAELRSQNNLVVKLDTTRSLDGAYEYASVTALVALDADDRCVLCGTRGPKVGHGPAVRVVTYYGAIALHCACLDTWLALVAVMRVER